MSATPTFEPLVMYGVPSDAPPLDWAWVDGQLRGAGTYWVHATGPGHPHPRPVWGLWEPPRLHLSVGSPPIGRRIAADPRVTIHLDSGVDVVIAEGAVAGTTGDAGLLARYDDKYDWTYTEAQYGPLTTVDVATVIAWRSAGWAGREGFQRTGRWRFGRD